MTEPRRVVAGLLDGRTGHFNAADLVTDARERRPGIGRATIFRALELFLALGIVERIDLPNGEHAYVVCEPAHHHHVVCTGCGQSTEIDDRGIRALTKKVARRTGYEIGRHRIELFGRCPACRGTGG